jgi:hypothetical protein
VKTWRKQEDSIWPSFPLWWWVAFAASLAFWTAVIVVAVHFIAKWW